jgi:hypothetical protein
LSFLRFAYYFLLATFAPRYLQRLHDLAYHEQRRVAESVRGSLWLLGIDPPNYLELRDSEICSECRREVWIYFPADRQCALCLRKWLDASFKASSKSKGSFQCQ